MHASVDTDKATNQMIVHLKHSLNTGTYNIPLTLKTYVPDEWKHVQVKQDNHHQQFQAQKDAKGTYILYHANANKGTIELSQTESH